MAGAGSSSALLCSTDRRGGKEEEGEGRKGRREKKRKGKREKEKGKKGKKRKEKGERERERVMSARFATAEVAVTTAGPVEHARRSVGRQRTAWLWREATRTQNKKRK